MERSFWESLVISFVFSAVTGTCVYFSTKQTIDEPTAPTVPPCCYVPGKGIQVCAEPGALMLPEETGYFKGVRK